MTTTTLPTGTNFEYQYTAKGNAGKVRALSEQIEQLAALVRGMCSNRYGGKK